MFKNYSSCEKCVHTSVCQYKIEFKDIYNKISGKWDDLNPPEIFLLNLDCQQYKPGTTVRNNGGFII